MFAVNSSIMALYCPQYRSHHQTMIEELFYVPDDFNPDAIRTFIEIIHWAPGDPQIDIQLDLFDIASFFGCELFPLLFRLNSHNSILSQLQKKPDSVELIEEIIRDFKTYIINPKFASLPIEVLMNIFKNTFRQLSSEEIIRFSSNVSNIHGQYVSILLNLCVIPNNENQMNPFLIHEFSLSKNDDLNSNLSQEIDEKNAKIDELKKRKRQYKDELKKKSKEFEEINKSCNLITSFHVAACKGDIFSIEYLLGKGIDINLKYLEEKYEEIYVEGASPLHFAVHFRKMEVIQFLLNKGADINAIDNLSQNPLHIAVEKNNIEIVKYLVEKNAPVNMPNGRVFVFFMDSPHLC